jgi:hypothetical protein
MPLALKIDMTETDALAAIARWLKKEKEGCRFFTLNLLRNLYFNDQHVKDQLSGEQLTHMIEVIPSLTDIRRIYDSMLNIQDFFKDESGQIDEDNY